VTEERFPTSGNDIEIKRYRQKSVITFLLKFTIDSYMKSKTFPWYHLVEKEKLCLK
jgi:hypothetical protein